ncbi:hypothetical protein [Mycobacterium sp.]
MARYWPGLSGFAASPQLDLYARTPYYQGTGTFAHVPFGRLDA